MLKLISPPSCSCVLSSPHCQQAQQAQCQPKWWLHQLICCWNRNFSSLESGSGYSDQKIHILEYHFCFLAEVLSEQLKSGVSSTVCSESGLLSTVSNSCHSMAFVTNPQPMTLTSVSFSKDFVKQVTVLLLLTKELKDKVSPLPTFLKQR